ncbi:small subunit ribosomal protein S3e [Nematocida major]|uniref:small subunit ribosomal protein S3e n=1 Tax=Nematocida major TaxID=1912982 RepID=UPI00200770BD|nr:small subunit ribosomal protein S3e [Nematocida major]KAH9387318.1 small subunit ribosomal protein S3e [Nematocida major]
MSKIERRERRYERMADDLVIVNQGMMYAELNELFTKFLKDDGYAGMDYKPYESPIEITLKLGKPAGLLEDNKLRIKQLISLIQMRFGLEAGSVSIFIEQIKNKALNAQIQADQIRERLGAGIPVRRAVSGAIRTIMEGGAYGVQIIISGKLKGQRARSYKVVEGTLMHSGNATKDYVKKGMSSILLKQGILGIQVAITLDYDPTGKNGTPVQHPSRVVIYSQEEMDQMRQPVKPIRKAYSQIK